MDVDALVAIDVHTHVHRSARGAEHSAEGSGSIEALGEYFGHGGMRTYTVPELVAHYRERSMGAVVFGVDGYTTSGEDPVPSNEEVAELAAENADVLIPFASIDPGRGAAGVRAARRLVTEHGVRGFKFTPTPRPSSPTTGRPTRCTRSSPSTSWSRCSTPARPGWARAPAAGAGCG